MHAVFDCSPSSHRCALFFDSVIVGWLSSPRKRKYTILHISSHGRKSSAFLLGVDGVYGAIYFAIYRFFINISVPDLVLHSCVGSRAVRGPVSLRIREFRIF